MHRIFKYSLPVVEKHEIELPINAQIIRVEDVDGLFYLWALVNIDPECPKEIRYLEFYKTGQDIPDPDSFQFLGTCKLFIVQELCLYVFENIYKYLSAKSQLPLNFKIIP